MYYVFTLFIKESRYLSTSSCVDDRFEKNRICAYNTWTFFITSILNLLAREEYTFRNAGEKPLRIK